MTTTPTTVEELLDRAQIVDCLHRYTRGVDRHDAELIRSAYHEDGIDDHGSFIGTRDEFVEWVLQFHTDHVRHQHFVSNITIDLDGDVAHTETYYFTVLQFPDDDEPLSVNGGRYLDRFERRDGRWAIAARVSVNEWQHRATPTQKAHEQRRGIQQSRDDVSYQRPLTIRPRGSAARVSGAGQPRAARSSSTSSWPHSW